MTRSRCDREDSEELAEKDPQIDDIDGSFSYSQKFFHISDGNLYSVFSPLQGRSYGVKPSFLRRQRCTVHQSRGKGHKNSRKLLKFHNFIPSESVISEREDSHELWKVHGECRLREEHGTKQIMVTNWSHSAACPPSACDSPTESNVLPQSSPETESESGSRSLRFQQSEDVDTSLQPVEKDRKHRRKPIVTKRVVPYSQYLSMVDECPLDLTCSSKTQQNVEDTDDETRSYDGSNAAESVKPKDVCNVSSEEGSKLSETKSTALFNPLTAPMELLVQAQCPEKNSMDYPSCSTLQSLLTGHPPSYAQYQQSCATDPAPLGECSRDSPRLPKVPRKPSHRTIIRKKLEDTFRQNGFLVKTKQVSDGDATFCKFKQLRKYTRYYLKSWHQHLPDEVNKLWKGFLPPKSNPNPAKKDN